MAIFSHVQQHGSREWETLAKLLNRTAINLQLRWSRVLDPSLTKGPWTSEEVKTTTYKQNILLLSCHQHERIFEICM